MLSEPLSDAGAALTDLILLTFRLNGRLLEAAEKMAAAGGLTAARWQVLGSVLDEPRSVSHVARQMGLARQSVQRVADLLVRDGFAEWEPNPRHARAKLLRPTPRAYEAIRRIMALQQPWSRAVGDEIGERDLRRAVEAMQRVLSAVEVYDNDP
jgi:DNA-binding MarR family transcriptional regulator